MKARLSQYRLILRKEFLLAVEQKNSWGKNEIKQLYTDIEGQIIDKMIEEEEQEEKLSAGPCKTCGGKEFNRSVSGSLECVFCFYELYR